MSGNGLDELLAARGRLRPGEVVTVVVGVAAELARLHAARRAHGAVGAAVVGIEPGGRPRLRGVRSAGGTDTGADVRALARLAGELVGPAPPQSMLAVIRDAEAGRHTAISFAGALLDACRPEPVRLPGERTTGAPGPLVVRPLPERDTWWLRHDRRLDAVRRRLPRARVVAAVVTPFLLLAGLLLWAEGTPGDSAVPDQSRTAAATPSAPPSGTPSDTPSGTATPPSPTPTAGRPTRSTRSSWLDRLDALDRDRAVAYARADPAGLRRVYVRGSRVLAADTATLRGYTADGLRVRGMRLEVSRVRAVRHSARTAVLAVTDRLADYEVVDTGGRLVRREPGRGPVQWRITLRNVEGRWLIADSRRA